MGALQTFTSGTAAAAAVASDFYIRFVSRLMLFRGNVLLATVKVNSDLVRHSDF